jgi:catechol 2,3-dioxygenase-like lactoylglutathione lyase family enzyme
MTKPNGVHHFAICTADIKTQIEFFYRRFGHGACRALLDAWRRQHMARLSEAHDQCSVAFVQSPEVGKIATEIGKTHSGNAGAASAPGTLQHIAFNVDTAEDLLAMRDRIRSRGVHVLGHIDHGFCKSIYFAGPENLTLEVSTSEGQRNPARSVDRSRGRRPRGDIGVKIWSATNRPRNLCVRQSLYRSPP